MTKSLFALITPYYTFACSAFVPSLHPGRVVHCSAQKIGLWDNFPEKNTLSSGHCPNGGKPPAQIDFDTFLKVDRVPRLEGSEGGAIWAMPKNKGCFSLGSLTI